MIKESILKKLSYSFLANLTSILVSTAMILIVPKYTSVEDYGMWQLFVFYFSYAGFFHFGWIDGIYLRYAGNNYDDLDKKTVSAQIFGVLILQFIILAIMLSVGHFFVSDVIKLSVLLCVGFLLPFVQFNSTCSYVLQITNRIGDYAKQIVAERLSLLILIMVTLFCDYTLYRHLYIVKALSMFISSIVSFWFCREICCFKIESFKTFVYEAKENIRVGSQLLIANVANLLIIGIVRYGISEGWDIATFGKISLTLSMCNFLMTFINAVSVVLFPMLKQIDEKILVSLYKKMRFILSGFVFFLLNAYYPLRVAIGYWLPKYADSLDYMVILFPICLFASQKVLLVNTYLKSLRQENLLMNTNVITVLLSIVLTFFGVVKLHNLEVIVFSIVILYAFSCFFSEYYLQKLLNINLFNETVTEIIMVSIFMISGYTFHNWLCMLVYLLACVIYVLFYRKKLQEYVKNLF